MEVEGGGRDGPIFRDIRRYYCDYCGISRSKKSLITSHLLSFHKEEIREKKIDEDGGKEKAKLNKCKECGAIFRKPAYLRQHMLSHSLERPFTCPVDDCHSSYRRKDHLARHLLLHQGKLFECPVENCNIRFSFQDNAKRHLKVHGDSSSKSIPSQKQHVCPEIGCGKVFRYASKLQTHEASHVKLDTMEVLCLEPGCMKNFTNEQCLKAHLQSCHRHIICEICGAKQLKKNIKRHLCSHEAGGVSERVKCNIKSCPRTFSTQSNLNQHVKAVHLGLRPFPCRVSGCEMRFSFKHVRENHEKSGCHVFMHGDFEESDEQVRLRPRGGQKRKCPSIEALMRKRVTPPNQSDSVLDQGPEYLSYLLSTGADD